MARMNRRNFVKTLGMFGAGAAGLTILDGVTGGFPGLLGSSNAVLAQPNGMLGKVVITMTPAATLHSYIAPEASFLVTTHAVETANSLVVVDTQVAQTFAAEARAYIDSIGKPIERVILSHEHPDHFGGGNQYTDAPFVSTSAIAESVQGFVDGGGLEGLAALLGEDEVTSEPNVPEAGIEAGEETIDGVLFEYDIRNNAEAVEQIVIRIPEARTMIVQDLIYNNAHFFPGVDRDNWLTILEDLRGEEGFDTLLAGHGVPTTPAELDNGIEYLTFVQETVAEAESADDIIAAVTERYPSYGAVGLLPFWQGGAEG